MVTLEQFRSMALSLPEATEAPHFEKTSFRVKNKIFATYDEVHHRGCFKLSPIDQDEFASADASIYPLDNKWGKQGWSLIDMAYAHEDLFKDALITAYCEVAPKKLVEMVRSRDLS